MKVDYTKLKLYAISHRAIIKWHNKKYILKGNKEDKIESIDTKVIPQKGRKVEKGGKITYGTNRKKIANSKIIYLNLTISIITL